MLEPSPRPPSLRNGERTRSRCVRPPVCGNVSQKPGELLQGLPKEAPSALGPGEKGRWTIWGKRVPRNGESQHRAPGQRLRLVAPGGQGARRRGRLCRASEGRVRSWRVSPAAGGYRAGSYTSGPIKETTPGAKKWEASTPCLGHAVST